MGKALIKIINLDCNWNLTMHSMWSQLSPPSFLKWNKDIVNIKHLYRSDRFSCEDVKCLQHRFLIGTVSTPLSTCSCAWGRLAVFSAGSTHIPGLLRLGGVSGCLSGCACVLLWSDSWRPPGLYPTRLLWPGNFQARILESTAISFSRGSSQPRDQIHISCVGRQILYHWATRDAPECL